MSNDTRPFNIVTPFATVEEFIAQMHPYCRGTSLFISTSTPLPADLRSQFEVRLADEKVVLRGPGVVVEPPSGDAQRGPTTAQGMWVEFEKLPPEQTTIFQWMRARNQLETASESKTSSSATVEKLKRAIPLSLAFAIVAFLSGFLTAYARWGVGQ